MKTVLIALAMSTATFFVAPAAFAAPGSDDVAPAASAAPVSSDHYFVEASVGNASISDWDEGTQASSPELLAGYRWNTDFGKLGFELGRANFGEIDSGFPSNGFAFGGATFKGHAIKAGVDLNWVFAERLYLEPQIGLMRLSYTGVQRDFPNANINYDETKIGHYVGVGFGGWITPDFAVGVNFDNYTADILGQTQTISVVSAGVQFQF